MLQLLFSKKKQLTEVELVEQDKKHVKLFIAIERNSLREVRECLQNGADPNRAVLNSPIGTTLLQQAIHRLKELEFANPKDADIRIVELLLSEGASAQLLDQLKRDAFFYASPTYETIGIDPERVNKTSATLNSLLIKKYPQITEKNVKEISKILTGTQNSSLNKLCTDTLKNVVSFLFVEPAKTAVFLKQLETSSVRCKKANKSSNFTSLKAFLRKKSCLKIN